MLERDFQSKVITLLKRKYPECIVLKNDPNYIQGFPDLTVFNNNRWAALEIKQDEKSSRQPNQEYYISKLSGMSYASFVYPENLDKVIRDLDNLFLSK